jgi:hypothetical protein
MKNDEWSNAHFGWPATVLVRTINFQTTKFLPNMSEGRNPVYQAGKKVGACILRYLRGAHIRVATLLPDGSLIYKMLKQCIDFDR